MALNIQAIAFDKDGVVFDTEKLTQDSLKKVCDDNDIVITQQTIDACVGLQYEKTIELLRTTLKAQCDFDSLILPAWENQRLQMIEQQGVQFIDGVESLIESLYAEGYPLALVTSDTLEGVLTDVNHARPDLLQYFSVIITVDDVLNAKPDAEPYQRASLLLGVDAENLLVIEDSNYGIEAACSAGANVLALAPHRELPDHINRKTLAKIAHHREVLSWLK